MRSFASLSEREILALAISTEEEDARHYDDLAEAVKSANPALAEEFHRLRAEEDGHRHRLLDLYRQKFGDHIPLIRRQDVKGFVRRSPVWFTRPFGPDAARKHASVMEAETKRFYEAAARRATDAGIRQLLGDLAEEERKHEHIAEQLPDARVGGPLRRVLVEAPRLRLHQGRLLARRRQPQRPHQPHRLAADEALHVMPADERDVVAELLPVQVQ